MIFTFLAEPGARQRRALTLARSIRRFAGRLADSPIWALAPGGPERLGESVRASLLELGVTFVPFEVPGRVWEFPGGARGPIRMWASRRAITCAPNPPARRLR